MYALYIYMKKIIGQTGGSSSKRPLNIRKNTNSYLQRTYNVRNFANTKQMIIYGQQKSIYGKTRAVSPLCQGIGPSCKDSYSTALAKQEQCYFGDIHEELPIAKATVSQHLSELKNAGLIQGTIEMPKVKYCINRDNWMLANMLFKEFFNQETRKTDCGCSK